MSTPPEELERRIDDLRGAVRRAVTAGDRTRARELRSELRAAEGAWEDAIAELERPVTAPVPETAAPTGGSLLPIREQVHQSLMLIGVPAAPRLIVAVHDAFFSGPLAAARLTSIRRDEERSFRSAPYARAYYLCAALTADLLAPARGLLALSTWPLDRRVIGPLSPRVDFLTAAIAVADGAQRVPSPNADARRLLWRFAVSIPGAQAGGRRPEPGAVAQAARAELDLHAERDAAHRQAAALRAQGQLDDVGQLFGGHLQTARGAAART